MLRCQLTNRKVIDTARNGVKWNALKIHDKQNVAFKIYRDIKTSRGLTLRALYAYHIMHGLIINHERTKIL